MSIVAKLKTCTLIILIRPTFFCSLWWRSLNCWA